MGTEVIPVVLGREHAGVPFYRFTEAWSLGHPVYADANGERVPYRFASQESLALSLENTHRFTETFTLVTRLGFDRELYSDYLAANSAKNYDDDPFLGPSPGNVVYDFSESEFSFSTFGHFNVDDKYRLALGYEYSYDKYDSVEGQPELYMNLKTFTDAAGRTVQARVGDGFHAHTHSVAAEANLEFHPLATLVLSARADKHDFTDVLWSPRIAWVAELNKRNIARLVWQKSVRMATTEELVKADLNSNVGEPEEFMGWELIYTWIPQKNLTIDVTAFYNEVDALGWDNTTNSTSSLGKLILWGLEGSLAYKTEKLQLGVNHSFVKQLDWENGPGIVRQGISVADYDINGLVDTGNDLSNWSNHTTKVYMTYKLRADLTHHANAQLSWEWQGFDDYVAMYDKKYAAGDAAWEQLKEDLRHEGFGDMDVRFNASMRF